jgi:hypothetical protein
MPEPTPLGLVCHQHLTTAAILSLDQLKGALTALVMPLKDLSRRLTYDRSFDNCTFIEVT